MKKDKKLLREINLQSKSEIDRALARIQREEEEIRKDLESRAKPIYELTREETFEVEDVVQESYENTVYPMSEWKTGSSSSGYAAGYSTNTRLKVRPIDLRIPVNILNFKGSTTVKVGDTICAVISRHEAHIDTRIFDNYTPPNVIYTDRDYRSNEEAIEIKILNFAHKKFIRTERAINYNKFIKKE